MSVRAKHIPDKATHVPLALDVFKFSSESRYAAMNLGYGFYPETARADIFQSYLRFRKNVYVDQTHMLDESVVRDDGTEHDEDDSRSDHFVVLENRGIGETAVVACMRLINRTEDLPLPVEKYYPEAFVDPVNAVQQGVESSRFVSKTGRLGTVTNLFGATFAFADNNQRGGIYGVVEEALEASLRRFGAESERIAEPKFLQEYNDVNVGIKINHKATKRKLGEDMLSRLLAQPGEVVYWGK